VVNGQAYLFDAGPGVVRRAQAAAELHGIPALEASNLTRLFFTHLHSDHTLGYPDIILTPWVMGRVQPLEVYGPKGMVSMTDHIKLAYTQDVTTRTEGLEHLSPDGLRVNVHEISAAGPIYKDQNITVRAFAVPHGSWPQAFGYAIDADGRSIVISGDTRPSPAIAEACRGCDVLVHEVYSAEQFNARVTPSGRQ
jgi:ribonuclease BN (tRNA processing enzyme)